MKTTYGMTLFLVVLLSVNAVSLTTFSAFRDDVDVQEPEVDDPSGEADAATWAEAATHEAAGGALGGQANAHFRDTESDAEEEPVEVSIVGQDVKLPVTPMAAVVVVLFVTVNMLIGAWLGSQTSLFKGDSCTRTWKGISCGGAMGLGMGVIISYLSLQSVRRRQNQDTPYLKLGPDSDSYVFVMQQYVWKNKIMPSRGVAWREAVLGHSPEAYQTRPLLWLHIHKEAGTFACLAAAANGERVVAPSTNCNWKDYDVMWSDECTWNGCDGTGVGGIGSKTPNIPTCQDRLEYFQRWNFTFGAIEREMHGKDLCNQFRYAVAIREPLHSIESKALFEIKLLKNTAQMVGVSTSKSFKLSWFKELLDKVFFENRTMPGPYTGLPGWKFLDNFKIRSVLGEEAFNLGPGEITEEHLRKATTRLQLFDLVKVLDVEASEKDWDGTSSELGWEQRVRHRLNQRTTGRKPKAMVFDEEAKKKLEEINKWDIQLFKHFSKQAQRGVKVQRTMARRFYSRLMTKMKKKRTAGGGKNHTSSEYLLQRKLKQNSTRNVSFVKKRMVEKLGKSTDGSLTIHDDASREGDKMAPTSK